MKKVTIKTVSKYFLYTLLCVVLFIAMSLISYYFSDYTNVFKWVVSSNCLISLISTVITMVVIIFKET
mgnify:FL=1